jgi:hypothetical protein
VELPSISEGATNLTVWDFRTCSPEVTAAWQVVGAEAACQQGRGLSIEPDNPDPQLTNSSLSIDLPSTNTRYLRLRMAARYDVSNTSSPGAGSDPDWQVSEWFWKSVGEDLGSHQPISMRVRSDSNSHVYWAYLSKDEVTSTITHLRLDPINAQRHVDLLWIAIDQVNAEPRE